jgi:MFS family permease
MVISAFISAIGNGLYMTSAVLYFTRVVHLSPGDVAIGLTIASLVGLLAGIPVGDYADRRGPREIQIVALVLLGVTMLSYIFVHDFAIFLVVACADMLVNCGANAVRGGLIKRVGGEKPGLFRANLRAVNNAGNAIGALAAAVAVQIDTPLAYRLLIITNALSFVAAAIFICALPHYEPVPRPRNAISRSSLHDAPYIGFAVIDGLMILEYQVMIFLLPIWIADFTHAPRWIIGAVFLLNTLLCVTLQVRVGGKVDTISKGGRAYGIAGLLFLFSCPAMALLPGVPGWLAALIATGAVAIHTFGEMWHASGTFALSFDLAPAYAQSEYQGLLGMIQNVGRAIAPTALTLICIDGGRLGWVGLGVFFFVVGLAAQPVTRWADRTRPTFMLPAEQAGQSALTGAAKSEGGAR